MKKTLVLLLALVTGSVFAAMPVEKSIGHLSTPIQLGVDEYHCLYPKDYGVHGLRLNCYFVDNRYMHGLDLGFWNVSEAASGVQAAIYRNETYDFGGFSFRSGMPKPSRSAEFRSRPFLPTLKIFTASS